MVRGSVAEFRLYLSDDDQLLLKTRSVARSRRNSCASCYEVMMKFYQSDMILHHVPIEVVPKLISLKIQYNSTKRHSIFATLHCVSKNAPPLTCCSFDTHDPITIMFGKVLLRK